MKRSKMKTKKPLTKTMKAKTSPLGKVKSAAKAVASAAKKVVERVTGPRKPVSIELVKLDNDGTVIGIGSGRKKSYHGTIVAWPGKGRVLTLSRTDSHKKRVFKTSKATIVTKDKDDAQIRHIRTENGSRYRLRVV